MNDEHYLLTSTNHMHSFAKTIANKLKGGDVLALHGDLGSGKTTFTQGLGRALGVTVPITSPTFLIMKQYPLPKDSSIKTLFHLDLYRLSSEHDVEAVGIDDVFADATSVTVIEWPEKAEAFLPPHTQHLYFSFIDENTREVTMGGKNG